MLSRFKRFLVMLASVVATLIGTLLAMIAMAAAAFGVGAAMGRALDLVQGALPRSLLSLEVAVDGWALFFAAYLLLWLPLSAMIKLLRTPVGPDPGTLDDDDDGDG